MPTVAEPPRRHETRRDAEDPLMLSGRPHRSLRNGRRSAAIPTAPRRRRAEITPRRPPRPAMVAKGRRPSSAVHRARSARAAGRRPSAGARRWVDSMIRRAVTVAGPPRCTRAATSARHRFGIPPRAGHPLAKHRRPGPGAPRRPTRVRSGRAALLRPNAASRARRSGPLPGPGRVSRAAGPSSGGRSMPRRARGIGRTQIRSAAASWCPPARCRPRAAGAAPCS
jgi:hypothetical protein